MGWLRRTSLRYALVGALGFAIGGASGIVAAGTTLGPVVGIQGYQVVTGSKNQTNGVAELIVACPTGKRAIAGGARIFGSNIGTSLIASAPEWPTPSAPTSWRGTARGPFNNSWGIRVDAICATSVPGYQVVRASDNRVSTYISKPADCPTGKRAIGGGARVLGNGTSLITSHPAWQPPVFTSWLAAAVGPFGESWGIHVDAICATSVPGYQFVDGYHHPANGLASGTVNCPTGKRIIGGGAAMAAAADDFVATSLIVNGPEGPTPSAPTSWHGTARGPSGNSWYLVVAAICGTPGPPDWPAKKALIP